MKLAHSLVITPGLAGLYTSAKEIILAERELGHDAFVVEPEGASKGMTDIDVPLGDLDEADVIIDHSGCDKAMLESGLPIVHVRHGRPLSSFLIEHNGGTKIYSHLRTIGSDGRYVAIVTMWQEHVGYWESLTGRTIDVIPAPVDLEHYSPDGPTHTFGKHRGRRNYVVADMWRDDCIPFEAIHEFLRLRQEGDKLHVYGVQQKSTAVKTLMEVVGDSLGEVGWAKDMAPIYRGATLTLTCGDIATRVVRESMACGCRVHSVTNEYWNHRNPRDTAKRLFNSKASALGLIDIAERSLVGV